MKKNPDSGNFLLIAGGAAAAYYFWPQLQAMFSGSPAATAPPAAAGTHTAAISDPATVASMLATAQTNNDAFIASQRPPVPPRIAVTLTPQPRPLSGIRRLGSAALIAQAAMAQLRTDAGPQVTNNSPIGPWTPGAEQLPGGCWKYGDTPVLVNCPPNTAPPLPRPAARGRCKPGYTMDAAGICARTDDQVILARLNSTMADGSSSAADAAADFSQISPSILGVYSSTVGVMPGTLLSSMLGLPANPTNGVMEQGNDGFNYLPVQGTYVRQGTATQATRPTGPIGPRIKLQGLGAIAAALPVTQAALIAASSDPQIAALIGNDPRAMLTIAQWNYFYTQATGVAQGAPRYPEVDPHALISAQQYQQWRQDAGLDAPARLGTIRRSAPGAFPLGGISDGPNRRPFIQPGNQNVFRIPGRGVRLGLIHSGGGNHRWARSPFPRPADWRMAE